MCRDHLPASWADLAGLGRKVSRFEGEMWPGRFLYGLPGAGMHMAGSVLVSDAFPGLVGPFGATGGRFGVIYLIFQIFGVPPGPLLFPYYPLLFPGVAGQDTHRLS